MPMFKNSNAYQNHIKWIFAGNVLMCIPTRSNAASSFVTILFYTVVLCGCVGLERFSHRFANAVMLLSCSTFFTLIIALIPYYPELMEPNFMAYAVLLIELASQACVIAADFCICTGFAEVAERRGQQRLHDYCLDKRGIIVSGNMLALVVSFICALFDNSIASAGLVLMAVLSIGINILYCRMLYLVNRYSSYITTDGGSEQAPRSDA